MEENEVTELTLDLNVRDAEEELQSFLKEMGSLEELAKDIGAAMAKAFAPLQISLQKTVTSIYTMTDALTQTTAMVQELMDQMSNEQTADQWLGGISAAIEAIAAGVGIAELLGKAGLTLGGATGAVSGAFASITGAITKGLGAIIATLGGGWVAAIIGILVAAVAAVIIFWDDITYYYTDLLPQMWGRFMEWLSGILAPVAEMFSPVLSAIGGFISDCWDKITAVWNGIREWAQTNIIQPIIDAFTALVQWFTNVLESIRQTVSDVFYNIGVIVNGCWEIIKAAWGIVAAWFHDNVIMPVCGFVSQLWETVTTAVATAWNAIKEVLATIVGWIYGNVIRPVADFFAGMWNGFLDAAKVAWEGVKSVFSKVTEFFGNIFRTAWEGVVKVFSVAGEIFTNIKDGILSAFKKIVNGIITGINSVVKVPFDGINSAIQVIRNIHIFDISPFTGLKTINVPQIPYLARGAVLPANRPFLAVVGDQRHGTNIEAPLATIQEAVALTMEDLAASNLAGHQATVGVLKEILEAVLGIRIGDADIARAADRYRRKMAVVNGTGW